MSKTSNILAGTIPRDTDQLPEGTTTNHVLCIHFCRLKRSDQNNVFFKYHVAGKSRSTNHAGPSGRVQAQCGVLLVTIHCWRFVQSIAVHHLLSEKIYRFLSLFWHKWFISLNDIHMQLYRCSSNTLTNELFW